MKAFKSALSPTAFYSALAIGLSLIILSTAHARDRPRSGEASRLTRTSSHALARRANNQTEFGSSTTGSLAHAILLANSQDSDTRDACKPTTLSPALWSKLDLNEYLLRYHGGQETSLEVRVSRAQCYIFKNQAVSSMSDAVGLSYFLSAVCRNWRPNPVCGISIVGLTNYVMRVR
jgi:hypothetical protein